MAGGPFEPVEVEVVDAASSQAQRALAAYFAELSRRFPEGFDHGGGLDGAASTYRPPHGIFLVARRAGDVVGCGALQHLDRETSEVKRMWVDPAVRGLGIGRRLLERLERAAVEAHRERVVLDTHRSLTEAIAMYRSLGYRDIGPYNDNPYASHWFEKRLSAQSAMAP